MATTNQQQQQQQQQQQFCVRWNSYQSNLQNAFPKLLTSEHFVDVTLACESEMIKCHKVVLSACSTYFEKLLVQNPCQHPIIFMKDMRFIEMQALVDFMYKGEVNVTQDELPSLLRSAEALQIRGLCGSDQLLSQHYLGRLSSAQSSSTSSSGGSSTVNGDRKESTSSGRDCDSTKLKEDQSSSGVENGTNTTTCVATPTSIKKETSSDGGHSDYGQPQTPTDEGVDQCHQQLKEESFYDPEDGYYDNDTDLMDTEYLEQDEDEVPQPGTSSIMSGNGATHTDKSPDFAIANVSCQYSSDGGGGGGGGMGGGMQGARRIRRSEAELRRAAECITRGQTFQTVSDQFNIPISTIRFYMARKGILPRRKRGRACSGISPSLHSTPLSGSSGSSLGGPGSGGGGSSYHSASGNTSPVGPPYHIVHYKLPTTLGAKLK